MFGTYARQVLHSQGRSIYDKPTESKPMQPTTKQYIGTKKVEAKPMTRGVYNNYRDWVTPSNEALNDQGYLVEYLDVLNLRIEKFGPTQL